MVVVTLGMHLRLSCRVEGKHMSYHAWQWKYLTKEVSLNAMPHAGDAVRDCVMECPLSVEYTIFAPEGLPTVKLRHKDFSNEQRWERDIEMFQHAGWDLTSEGEE